MNIKLAPEGEPSLHRVDDSTSKQTVQKNMEALLIPWQILYFLEISPQQDLISSHCTLQQDFKGGEISRAATSPLTRLAPAFDSANRARAPAFRVLRIRRPFSMRRDFEGSGILRCGEISRKYSTYVNSDITLACREASCVPYTCSSMYTGMALTAYSFFSLH